MKQQSTIYNFRWLMLVMCVFVLSTRDAQAYLDPGSSSYFFQILIAGLTAIVYFFSSIKRRVLALFGKKEDASLQDKVDEKKSAPDSENAPVAR